jgi:hypothetical protein
MTKTKFFMSTLGVIAAAGAVVASFLVKKRGNIKVEGEIETKGGGPGMPRKNRGVRGSATMGANRQS